MSRIEASLISIGRLMPQITSIRPPSITEIARLEGVPPNMSVRITTPAAVLHARGSAEDVGAPLLHVVFGADRDGLELRLRTHDMLQRRPESRRELAVGHEDHSDHQISISRPADASLADPSQRIC